ncbi:hypothetical protein NKH54_22785 [Mesorhizobium sp. M1004]|uniref:hypothetical protein n=1 Tax=Mesorhizobium sp. M1004 TaxID=2957046 RepID=UPI00333CD47B
MNAMVQNFSDPGTLSVKFGRKSNSLENDAWPFASSPRRREALSDEPDRFTANIPASANHAEKIFDTLIALKVETSKVAMHLSIAARNRIFAELDYILDVETWDEGDYLPDIESYKRFLKWIIFTGDTTWTSLGVDDGGRILVAWVREQQTMTANFDEVVRWTKRADMEGAIQISLGEFTLTHFARQSNAFLGE